MRFLIVLALLLSTSIANAKPMRAYEIFEWCEKSPNMVGLFLRGVIEEHVFVGEIFAHHIPNDQGRAMVYDLCIPDGTRIAELQEVYCRYLEVFSSSLDAPAVLALRYAAENEWNCLK